MARIYFERNDRMFYIEVPETDDNGETLPIWEAVEAFDREHGSDFADRLDWDDIRNIVTEGSPSPQSGDRVESWSEVE